MRDATGAYRHVVLVGGTSQIGQAIVKRQIADGTRSVTLLARDPVRAQEDLAGCRAQVTCEPLDLNQRSEFPAISERIGSRSDIDLVIVAIGMLGDAERAAHDPVHAADIMDTTFVAPASIIGAFAEQLVSQGHGCIVVLSSVAGYRVRGENHVYGAAKAGLDGFAQGLAQRMYGTGVDILIVRPGFVHTRMTDGMDAAPFSVSADRVAADIANALRKGNRVVWSPPPLKLVMGLLRHLPSGLFRRVSAR